MTDNDLAVKLAETESRSKSNCHRIGKLEHEQEALGRLVTAVEVMAKEQQHQTAATTEIKTTVAKLDEKVETLEQKPAKHWEAVVGVVLTTVLAAVVGYCVAQLFGK